MKTFKLTDVQADAILNMRLRNLRKLEEMEIRAEDKALREERTKLKALIGSTTQQWKTIAGADQGDRETVRPEDRRSASAAPTFAEAPEHDEAAIEEAMVVREPITVVVSEKGWIRALRGHVSDLSGVTFKGDDALKFAFPTETTAKILIFATNGRFYTLEASKLPGGRGHGEPVRLFIDLEQDADVVAAFAYQGGRKFLVASHGGNGFVVPEDECSAPRARASRCSISRRRTRPRALTDGRRRTGRGDRREPQDGDLPARPGARDGARPRRAAAALQGGGLSDVTTFKADDGLTWIDTAGRSFTLTLKELERLARQPRRCRPHPARAFPDEQQVPRARRRQRERRNLPRTVRDQPSRRTAASVSIPPAAPPPCRRRTACRPGGGRRPSRSDYACAVQIRSRIASSAARSATTAVRMLML